MIGIPVTSDTKNPNISDRFGRSEYFAIIKEDKILCYLKNRCKSTPVNAGKVALKLLLDNGVSTIIAPYIGSTTKDVIKSHNLKVLDSCCCNTVSDALNSLKSGKLNKML